MKNCKYLGTFNQPEQVAASPQPVAAPAPQPVMEIVPPQPEPVEEGVDEPSIPTSALPDILEAMSAREGDALARLEQAYQSQEELLTEDLEDGEEEEGSGRVTMRDLQGQIASLQDDLYSSRIATYRQEAINQAIENGENLVDSLVFGDTPEEIDASIQVASAEYDYIASQVAQDIRSKQSDHSPVAEPQGVVSQIGGQPVVQQQPQTHPVSAPSMIQATGVPQQQQTDGILDPNVLRHLTTTGVRTGEYGMFRHQIIAALRNGATGPGGRKWAFGDNQLQPPVQQMLPAPAPPQAQYAGVQPLPHPVASPPITQSLPMQQPMVAAAPANPGFTPMVPGMMAQQSAQYIETPTGQRVPTQATGYAAQPFEVDQGTPIDSNAARAAAQAAVAAKRATQ